MYEAINIGDELMYNMNYKKSSYMPTKKPRYTVTVDEELLKRIDNFRFENRYPSRSAATLELIRLGMETIEKQNESKGKGHAKDGE